MGITFQYVRVSREECSSLTFDDSGKRLEELLQERNSPKDKDELSLICWKYSCSGNNGWKNVEKSAKKLKLSEEKLKEEIKKRGLHIWFDLDKLWDEMHKLLNGVSLHEEQKKETVLTLNKSAEAKPSKLVKELDSEVERLEKSIQSKTKEYSKLVDESGQDPFGNHQPTSFMVNKFRAAISTLPDEGEEDVVKEIEADLRSLLDLLHSIEKDMNEVVLKMQNKEFEEIHRPSQMTVASTLLFQERLAPIFTKIVGITKKKKKTDQNPWSKKERGESPLLIAVTGADTITGWDGGYGPARYLTVDQVKLISHALRANTYKSLANKNKVNTEGFEETFDQFSSFFQEATKNKEAIICVMT